MGGAHWVCASLDVGVGEWAFQRCGKGGSGLLKMSEVKQFASKVVNFSSQYGTAGTSSYTASNLASSPRVFPKYGDYTEAFVLVSLQVTISV